MKEAASAISQYNLGIYNSVEEIQIPHYVKSSLSY